MTSPNYKKDKYLGRIHGKTDVKVVGVDTVSASYFQGEKITVTAIDSAAALTIDATNVGIGGAPSTTLHVQATDPRIRADATADNHPGFELSEAGTRKWVIYNQPDGGADSLIFKSTADRFEINPAGKGVTNKMTPVIANFSDGEVRGDIIKMDHADGSTATVAGKLYFLHTDGKWYGTDADNPIWSGENLLAIAVGTNPAVHGMLIKGLARIGGDASDASGDLITGTPLIGRRLFVSTANNSFSIAAPTGVGDAVRGIGWVLQTTGNDMLIWFDPDVHFDEIPDD